MSLRNDDEDDYDDRRADGRELKPHRGVLIMWFGILGVLTLSWALAGVVSIIFHDVLSKVLGILGSVVCGFLGVVACALGRQDLGLMRRGLMDKEGETMTRVGYILGLVAMILTAPLLIFWVWCIILVVALAGH